MVSVIPAKEDDQLAALPDSVRTLPFRVYVPAFWPMPVTDTSTVSSVKRTKRNRASVDLTRNPAAASPAWVPFAYVTDGSGRKTPPL